MAQAPVVALVGMQALRKDLSKLALDERGPLFNAMKRAGYAAVLPVVGETRGRLPHLTGTLAGDVRASGTTTGGTVRMGRGTIPYAGWTEFGGTRPQGPEDRAARQYLPNGRYLFPAARTLAQKVLDLYIPALQGVFDSGGSWTNTSENGAQVHD
jgi:hypothetical protein